MGDRANVCVQNPDTKEAPVYLYSHWGGENLPFVVQQALNSEAGRGRWQDPTYLTRIIFCKMIGDDVDGETGYGISSTMCDNEHPIIVVSCDKQKIGLATEDNPTNPYVEWTFEAYCKLSQSKLKSAWERSSAET